MNASIVRTSKLVIATYLLLGLFGSLSAWAGRPLATDDAGTADAGTCQLESWVERTRDERAWITAPACGLAPSLELGLDYTRPSPRETLRAAGGIAVKWVPEGWQLRTPIGELNFGLALSAAFERPTNATWRTVETGGSVLATLQPGHAWTLHMNLGGAHDRGSERTAALLNLAAEWTPRDDVSLFVEVLTNNRRAEFGGTVVTAGGRWWLIKDQFGLDLTAGRENGAASVTTWSVGIGWYGLRI